MGINKFHDFIRKRAPQVYREIHLSEYMGKRIAVDISGLIYKFKILNKDRWLDSFAYLIIAFRKNKIHPIFVYEGEAPKEKDAEKTKRSQQRQAIVEKASSLRDCLDKYYETQEVGEVLQVEMKKLLKMENTLGGTVPINTSALEKRCQQIESQIVKFTDDEKETLDHLFDLFGIQYTTSPGEAETLCASMAIQGIVDAVVSNDSDVCAYGVKKFLYEINGLTETCIEIDHDEVIRALNFTREEFLDFCILLGCDYNDNIPGIGPVNAYKLLQEHRRIEQLPSRYDTSILNYSRTRELFATRYEFDQQVLSTDPNLIDLYNFLKMKNSRIKYETLENAFRPTEIVFEE